MITQSYYEEDKFNGSYLILNGNLLTEFTSNNNDGFSDFIIGSINKIDGSWMHHGKIAEILVFDLL